ncbi:deoxynucleotidyltransferase terminal-interacting protein 2 isoform X2 [Centruroides vittatus]|uniref:deoxynucleotidyltransferase terminal-interacting protein 2 isoform X2 n=1 Tax=Centruroides vittatus TaxID=120091 RepID=UPI00350F4305
MEVAGIFINTPVVNFKVETRSKYASGVKVDLSKYKKDADNTNSSFFLIDNKPSNISTSVKKEISSVSIENETENGVEKNDINADESRIKSTLNKSAFKHSKKSISINDEKLKELLDTSSDPQKEQERTAGPGWYHMSAPEMTDEIKNDLTALQMRRTWDRKSFYKKNDMKTFPKYFQIGTIVETSADYYHSRIPKKQRKRTIVEELLADEEFRQYSKKKVNEINSRKTNFKSKMRRRNKCLI